MAVYANNSSQGEITSADLHKIKISILDDRIAKALETGKTNPPDEALLQMVYELTNDKFDSETDYEEGLPYTLATYDTTIRELLSGNERANAILCQELSKRGHPYFPEEIKEY